MELGQVVGILVVGDVPTSEVLFGKVFEHCLLQLRLCQKPFDPRVLLLQLDEPFGRFCLHAAIQLTPSVVAGMRDLQKSAGVCDYHALVNLLVSRFQLVDDLLRRVASCFIAESPVHSARMRIPMHPRTISGDHNAYDRRCVGRIKGARHFTNGFILSI